MKEIYIAGVCVVIIGILMIVFRKPWGVMFCRNGKSFWKNHKQGSWFPVDKIYKESEGPRLFKFMGIVFIVTGLIFAVFGWIIPR